MGANPRVEIRLLGRFALTADGHELPVVPVGERVLAFLGLHGTVGRNKLAWTLWQDQRDDRASHCLRSALWRLPKPAGKPLVFADRGELSLARDVAIDVRRSRGVALTLLDASDGTMAPSSADLECWTLDLLPGWYDDWLVVERERYRQLRLHALERLSDRCIRSHRYARAIELALQVVASDPLRESAHRCIVRAHLAEGNLVAANGQLATYLAALSEAELVPIVSRSMAAEFAAAGVRAAQVPLGNRRRMQMEAHPGHPAL